MIKYPGDNRTYLKYKKDGDSHYYVDCCSKKVDPDGKLRVCSYIGKREDRHKEKINKGELHICNFILKKTENTLLNYFEKDESKKQEDIYCEEALKQRLAILTGKKNLSIETSASNEMYEFIIYCISYGIFIAKKDVPIEQQAKEAYHHFKSTAISQTMVESARIIKKQIMENFAKAVYISVAIDEGSTFGIKNLDFNIENPLLKFKPFPAQELTINDQTAKGYTEMILNGLSAIKLYKVNIASCICDGNKAQKKAFSFAWTESLRFKDSWLKGIIFIPCLCHRIDNGYKYHVTHDPALKEIIERIKSYPAILNEHRNEIGAKCPPPVSTRWLYDFDIIAFILKHKDKAHKYVELNESEMNLYKVLLVFKSLLKIFENPNTYFWRAFYYLERGLKALEELESEGNPFAAGFRNSLFRYTLGSDEGGLWVLGYLLTRSGQQDFKERIRSGVLSYKGEGLPFFTRRREKKQSDPLEESIAILIDEADQEEQEHQEANEQEVTEEEEEAGEDIYKALQIAAVGKVQAEEQESNSNEEEEDDVSEHDFSSTLDSAKKTLKNILIENERFSIVSTGNMLRHFNEYLDMDDPFPNEQTEDGIGFSWNQIKISHPSFKGIATVALKLHNSGVSESSCERTLSSQKLIYNARRRHSNKLTLNARLVLMRACLK